MNKQKLSCFFITLSLIIYLSFLSSKNSTMVITLEYFGIVLCCLFSFLLYSKTKDAWILRIALLFTLFSDTFLLLTINHEIEAMITFSVAQLLYAYRLLGYYKQNRDIAIWIRIIVIIFFQVIGLMLTKQWGNLLLHLVLFYFANLLCNVIYSLGKGKLNWKFSLGLLLFLFCDIMVGLHNMDPFLPIPQGSIFDTLIHIPFNLIWFFYFPSQVLITLSGLNQN